MSVETPKVMIATPRYDDSVIAASYETKKNAERNELHPEDDAVNVAFEVGVKGSLLPYCMNQCLAEAMNQRDAGNVTHFGMVHSDVAADPGWLNQLWSIMRQRGDAVVSAVVCIKEPNRSRTSCAVGSRSNKFLVKRSITTSDRLAMPETFSTSDVSQDADDLLLINTGLWLADLRHEFWDDFSFGFDDEIVRDPETGKRYARVQSEDWRLSRELDAAGLPYSATWKVATWHTGPSIWCSHELPPIFQTA